MDQSRYRRRNRNGDEFIAVVQPEGYLGAGLDLDDVSRVVANRVQDVRAGQPAAVNEACLEQGLPGFGGLHLLLEHLIEVGHGCVDLDATGIKLLGQCANFVPLIENGLPGGGRSRGA